MKMIDHLKHQLTGAVLGLALVLLAARAGAENRSTGCPSDPGKGKMPKYATDNKTWHALKPGDILQPGVVIQTALHATVDIQLVDREAAASFQSVSQGGEASAYAPPPSNLAYSSEEAKSNIIRIMESSVLAIDKLILERTGVDEVAETQLDLRAWDRSWATSKNCQPPPNMRSRFRMELPASAAVFITFGLMGS